MKEQKTMKAEIKKMSARVFFSLLVLLPSTAFAQQAGESGDLGKVFHIGVIGFFLFVFIILLTLIAYHNRTDDEIPSLVKGWKWFRQKMTHATPIENEEAIILEHDYDGIKELDNVLPPWWKYLFYVTIVFAAIYILNYHVLNIWALQDAEYRDEVKLADDKIKELIGSGAFITEKTVVALTDPTSISKGAEIFQKNCTSCHGMQAQGNIGPNLTDDYWIHGGGAQNVFKTISNGVLDKGMLSWKTQLRPKEIQQVTSYVLSLHGSNPPNAKAPQGNLWAEPPAKDSATTKTDQIKAL
jgi:cytochrome c oxidase cbb3-type subunit 3